jgi:hypothetical protein
MKTLFKDYRTRMKTVLNPEIKDTDADIQKEMLDEIVEQATHDFKSKRFDIEKKIRVMKKELNKQCNKEDLDVNNLLDLELAIRDEDRRLNTLCSLADNLGLRTRL